MLNPVHALIEQIPITLLKQAAQEISERYRLQQKPYLTRTEHYWAYLLTRFPATLAAITQVLKPVQDFKFHSFLDLGAGPGTGLFAALQYFQHLEKITLLEMDSKFIDLGKKIIERQVVWQQATLPCALEKHDLVLMSYSLNEMMDLDVVVNQAWEACEKVLVIIEPGTPKGYDRIIQARTLLLKQNAHMIAPCPNALPCPMQQPNWCHFYARVQRSKLHKQLKGGELGYEDEKFSYLIVGRELYTPADARIIAKPVLHKGWVELPVCSGGEISIKKISAKDAEYKSARKANWGDAL